METQFHHRLKNTKAWTWYQKMPNSIRNGAQIYTICSNWIVHNVTLCAFLCTFMSRCVKQLESTQWFQLRRRSMSVSICASSHLFTWIIYCKCNWTMFNMLVTIVNRLLFALYTYGAKFWYNDHLDQLLILSDYDKYKCIFYVSTKFF